MAVCGLAILGIRLGWRPRMDLFRIKSIDPTPNAFFESYANWSLEPSRSLHELSIDMWLANQCLAGEEI